MFALIRRRRDRIAVTAALLAPVAVCAGLIPVRTTLVNTDAQTTALLLPVGIAATELAVAARRRGRVVRVDEALLAVVQSTATREPRSDPHGL